MNNQHKNRIMQQYLTGNNPADFAVSTDIVETLAQAVFANFNSNPILTRAT